MDTAAAQPAPEAPVVEIPDAPPKPAPRFVGAGWSKDISLGFPLEYDGVTYETIRINAITVKQYQDAVDAKKARMPMFFTVDGAPVPDEVIDALALTDSFKVSEATLDFLPSAASSKDDQAKVQ